MSAFNFREYYFAWLKTKGTESYRCKFTNKNNKEEFYICKVYPTKEGAKHPFKANVRTLIDGSWCVLQTYNNEFYSGMRDSIIYSIEHNLKDSNKKTFEEVQQLVAPKPVVIDTDFDADLELFCSSNL